MRLQPPVMSVSWLLTEGVRVLVGPPRNADGPACGNLRTVSETGNGVSHGQLRIRAPVAPQEEANRACRTSRVGAGPYTTGRGITAALLIILLLGALARLFHFWAISGTALMKFHMVVESDMRAYWEWAHKILAGDLLGRDTYQVYTKYMQAVAPLETWYRWWGGKEIFRTAPLYPYLVAGLLSLSGHSLHFVMLVQLLVGVLHPLVLCGLARKLFDARTGLVAAFLTALYGPFIFYQGVLLRDWLPPILEPLSLLALLKARESGRGLAWGIAGAALGLALLTKESVLLFIFLVGLWLLWEYRSEWRRAVGAGACLLIGLLLCLSPLVIRNLVVGAPPFSLSNRALSSFITGNAADSVPVGWAAIPGTMKMILQRSDGKLLPVIRETLKTYQGHYGAFLFKELLKLGGLVDAHEETGEGVSFYYGLEISPVLRLTFRYGFIFPLGVAGFLVSLPAWRRHRLIYIYLTAVLGGLMFSMVQERYRLTLVPVLTLYAAAFLVWLVDALRKKQAARALVGLGLVLGITLTQQVALPLLKKSMGYGKGYGWGRQFLAAAKVYESEGQLDRAVAEMVRLRERARHNARIANIEPIAASLEGEYRTKWVKQLLEQGRWNEAKRELQLAEAAYAEQPAQPGPQYNLALLYISLGEPTKAKALLRRFLELEPDGPKAERARRLLIELGDSR